MNQVFKEVDLRKGRRHIAPRREGGRSRLAAAGLCFRTPQLCASPVPEPLASQLQFRTPASAGAAESFEGVGTASDEHAGRHENWTRGELTRLEKRWVQTQTMVSSSEAKGSTFPLHPPWQQPRLLGAAPRPPQSDEPVSRWLGPESSFLWPLSSPEAPSSTAAPTLAPSFCEPPHPHSAPLAATTAPSPRQLHSLSGLCTSPGHTHPAQKLSASPSRFLLMASVRAAGAVASLHAAPYAALGLPAAPAASCESAFSSLPAKVKPSPLAWPGFTSGLRSRHTAAWLWGWRGYPCRGEVTPSQARGQGPRDVRFTVFQRETLQTNPRKPLSQRLKKGRETQAVAVGPWLLKDRPFSPRGCPRGRPGEGAPVCALCPVQFRGPEHLLGCVQESEANKQAWT
ncbi:uncharacterized protein LOC113931045 isoform X1 [Zalophus californianus]|uniref:Uncharacterized protein LOC113931045 isoform X1 n=1 Tax=Zalophus californianus TaxID=9704 RepID=A0A6J2E764_ZALCA|nr:uncharacterized protein LOC113931045 isoform X1 [Zalophus californianus]